MVVVFASFVLSTDPTVKMLAIGMAFAVLIDASLVRMILVPSIMALLDARAWWMPRWMEPIVPQLQLEGSTAPAPAGLAPTTAATDTEAEAEPAEAETAADRETEAATETEAETATASGMRRPPSAK
jgi:RND superfamily putative drug exporter